MREARERIDEIRAERAAEGTGSEPSSTDGWDRPARAADERVTASGDIPGVEPPTRDAGTDRTLEASGPDDQLADSPATPAFEESTP